MSNDRVKFSGLTPRPWVKLWRDEHGLFGRLPLFARALAAEILKVTEMDGSIVLGGREPVEALALALGADTGDRRLLRRYLPMLIEVGYVVRDGDALRLPAWSRRQELDANPTRVGREPNANPTRTERESDANTTRTGHEIGAKSAEALNGTQPALLLEREEEKEGEVDREIRASATEDVARGLGVHVPKVDRLALMELLAREHSARVKVATGKPGLSPSACEAIGRGAPAMAHRKVSEHLETIADWLTADPDPLALFGRVLDGAARDAWMVSAGLPLGAIAESPAKYLAPAAPQRGKRDGFQPPADHSQFEATEITDDLFKRETGT